MLSTFSGCKEQIPSGKLAERSKAGGGGWEEDNKATGEGHEAMEIVSGMAEWWVKRHERGGVRRVGTEEGEREWEGLGGKELSVLAGEERPSFPTRGASGISSVVLLSQLHFTSFETAKF